MKTSVLNVNYQTIRIGLGLPALRLRVFIAHDCIESPSEPSIHITTGRNLEEV
jgi:hypothetical protein